MPALVVFGKRWYTTSDMLPIPALIFATLSLVWLVVFAVVVSRLDVWKSCTSAGVHYMVTTAALLGIYGASVLLEGAMVGFGMRGTCLEISKRRPVVSLLYAQAVVRLIQVAFLVYGTIIIFTVEPTCWTHPGEAGKMRGLTEAMIWSTWGLLVFLGTLIYLLYNGYQRHESRKAWEKRLRTMSLWLRCQDTLAASSDNERGAPLPSIAHWISGLFANVDLSPTDLTEAIVLTAAAQSMRRKMRIKKALRPALSRASSTGSEVTSVTSSGPSEEDLSSILSPDGSETDSSDREVRPARRKTAADSRGALEHPQNDRRQTVAVPEGYPKDWSSMADKRYAQTAKDLQSSQRRSSGTSTDISPSDWPSASQDPSQEVSILKAGGAHQGFVIDKQQMKQKMSGDGGGLGQSSQVARPKRSSQPGSSMHTVAGTESDGRLQEFEPNTSSSGRSSLESGSQHPESSAPSFISLSKVSAQMMDSFNESSSDSAQQPVTPKERFGITSKKTRRRRNSHQRNTQQTPEQSTGQDHSKEANFSNRSRGDPSLPSSLAGKLQAGLNEPSGGLPPAEEGELSRAFTFESSIPTGARTSLEVTPGDLAQLNRSQELITDEGTENEGVVPLERKEEDREAPVITPSEEVVSIANGAVSVHQAVEGAVGHQERVEYSVLEEATKWARFASAVYAVMPFSQQKKFGSAASKLCVCRKPVTEESVRDAIVELADIDSEDLLYFSHSNVALSHLPYMVALDRKSKTVVVAIRGTMSLADLVTDAVVHPESLAEWLPAATRKAKRKAPDGEKKAYGHAGITSAAKAVLEDLEVHGILHALLQPEEVRRKSLEYRKSLSQEEGKAATLPNGTANGASHAMHSGENGHEDTSGHQEPDQEQVGQLRRDTQGAQSGGVWPSGSFRSEPGENETARQQSTREERDEMASAVRNPQGSTRQQGEATGAAMQKNLDTKGWQLVITGHSLGAGAAALISLKIHDRYPDLKCWAFSPPGGLVSRSLQSFMGEWCTSVVVGKDAVPRMSVNNLNRLMDEMVTSLARCRYHKLRVLFGGWWRKESRPPPQHLFHSYRKTPLEARLVLERYQRCMARKGKAKDMFPPGRVLFVRPLKIPEQDKDTTSGKRVKQAWDAVWVTAQQLMGEGILVSPKMLQHHMIQTTLIDALGYSIRHHPDNPKPEWQKREEEKEQKEMQEELHEVRVEGEGHGALDLLSSPSSST